MRKTALERFIPKRSDADEGGCRFWKGALNKDGYGSFWSGSYIRGDTRAGPVMVLAHRWAYEHFVGPIPKGLYVLHTCDNPSCVEPAHLRVGTQADNVRDCSSKGRRNQSRDLKLNPVLRDAIASMYAEGKKSQESIGALFGVSQATVSYIIRRRRQEGAPCAY